MNRVDVPRGEIFYMNRILSMIASIASVLFCHVPSLVSLADAATGPVSTPAAETTTADTKPADAKPADAKPADIVIVNAKVFDARLDGAADALAIAGDRIVAVGRRAEIENEKNIGPATLRIDAGGGSVTPGFNDAHVHFLSGSLALTQIDLTGADSAAEAQARIAEFAKGHPDQAWIVGRGWVYGAFPPTGLPDKALLDAVVPDRPAVMKCYDGHTLWVNSAALSRAKITRATPDPAGGVIVRDPTTGDPTGVLKESAQALIEKVLPDPAQSEQLAALRTGIAAAHRLGVTSVQDAGVGLKELALFDTLRVQDQLPLRIMFALEAEARIDQQDIDNLESLRSRFPKLNIGAVKLFVDGVIESHTAAMLAPYANQATRGLPKVDGQILNRTVEMLDRRGWQIMVHAIGDGGVRMVLDALEHAQKVNPPPSRGRRHRLEHIETISQEDIHRFAELGVVASMQPYHANPDSNLFNVWAVNLGAERTARAWAWKSIQDAGGRLAFGSDWPVVGIDPRLGMHTALTRQTLAGEPPGGFVPQQRLPLRSVIEAYTLGSAYAEFAEDQKGRLTEGLLADVVIWNKNLFALSPEQVSKAEVAVTILGGRVVYRAAATSAAR